MTETDITDRWLSNELVDFAHNQVDGDDRLAVLEKLVEIMNDLEDKFPGIPFGEILSPARASRTKLREHLSGEMGMDAEEVDSLLGVNRAQEEPHASRRRRLDRPTLFARVDAGADLTEFDPPDRRHVKALRRPETEADREVGRMVALGFSQSEVKRRTGRASNTYQAAKLRLEFAAWKRSQQR